MNRSVKRTFISGKGILTLLMIAVIIYSISGIEFEAGIFHNRASDGFLEIIRSFARPDISVEVLIDAFDSTIRTLIYAVTGMSVALMIAFMTGIFASGLLNKNKTVKKTSKLFWRGMLGSIRGIHELVWAWIFVAYIGLSPVAGVLAIGIPYGASLGRVFADIFNDVSNVQLISIEKSGGSKLQTFFYGHLPSARDDLISYSIYRLECAVRSSVIMSFVGLGGLGYKIQLALSDLNYSRGATYIYFLIILIALIEIWSNRLRRSRV